MLSYKIHVLVDKRDYLYTYTQYQIHDIETYHVGLTSLLFTLLVMDYVKYVTMYNV